MLRIFETIQGVLREKSIPENDKVAAIQQAKWVDLLDPTDEEHELITSMNVSDTLPDIEDVEEIESTARYFINKGNIHIHSLFLHHGEGTLKTATIAFVIKESQLLTFRDVEVADFRLLRMRARRGNVKATTPIEIMIALLEQKVEDLADALEDIYKDLEDSGASISAQGSDELEKALINITYREDENGKIHMCLMDTRRSISYLQRHLLEEKDFESCREMLRDIDTLSGHSKFLFEKINFLMNASQGFINIKQNQIIKTVSAAAVIFMPPTLVTGMYGMNFTHMPELNLTYGYYMAQGVMLASAVATMLYFKWKNLL